MKSSGKSDHAGTFCVFPRQLQRCLHRICSGRSTAHDFIIKISRCENLFFESYEKLFFGFCIHIQRIDNMLAGLESDLQQCEAQLDNARVQLSNAKAAVDKPFPQEDELKTKLARLDELNILLNLDKRENEIVDGEPDESEPKEKKRDMER